jgi:pantoate kinase
LDKVRVFVPAHLTGFFEICNKSKILSMGSRGAGVSITKGVLTEIMVEKSVNSSIEISINNKKEDNAKVSQFVVDEYLKEINDNNLIIKINHIIEFPIGNGFGASAGGALGVSYGLNILMNRKKTRNECAQIAHKAEVMNQTGLGDVIAQTYGGVEIRLEPGAPGYGILDQIFYPNNLKVICYSLGKIDTDSIIGNESHKRTINKAGRNMVKRLLQDPSVSNLMQLSYEFARNSNLIPDEIQDILSNLHEKGYSDSSMIMLGKSLFCLSDESNVEEIKEIIHDYSSNGILLVADIDDLGARVVN